MSDRHRRCQVLLDCQPRDPELFRDLPLLAAFHQYFVSEYIDLVHLEHPPSGPEARRFGKPAIRPPGGSLSERRLDHFPSGASTFASPSHDSDQFELYLIRGTVLTSRTRREIVIRPLMPLELEIPQLVHHLGGFATHVAKTLGI